MQLRAERSDGSTEERNQREDFGLPFFCVLRKERRAGGKLLSSPFYALRIAIHISFSSVFLLKNGGADPGCICIVENDQKQKEREKQRKM